MSFLIAETNWLDIIPMFITSVAGLGILVLGLVAYYKIVMKGNGGKKKDEDTLARLVTALEKQNGQAPPLNIQGCPNTEDISKIKDVTLRDNTPLQMNMRNIKNEQRIKNIETASIAGAQHQLDARRVAQENTRLNHPDATKDQLKMANNRTGEFDPIDIKPIP